MQDENQQVTGVSAPDDGWTYESEGPKCPYCGRQYTADEPHYYDYQNYTEETCDECGQTFDVEVCTSTDWSCHARANASSPR